MPLVIIPVVLATRMKVVYMVGALSKPPLRLDAWLSRLSRDSPLSPLFDVFLWSQQQLCLLLPLLLFSYLTFTLFFVASVLTRRLLLSILAL